MKRLLLFFLKPLSFLPAIAMMFVIFNFSAQTGDLSGNLSYEISHKIVTVGNQLLNKNLDEAGIAQTAHDIEYPVRKLAHMIEYFLLAVAVSFPFYVYGLRGFGLMLVAGFICVGFAAGDEYHQSFVAGRGPSLRDVGIDSIGVFAGILTVRIICFTFLAPARAYERAKERIRRRERRHNRSGRRSDSRYDYDDYDDYEEVVSRPKNYFKDFEEDDYYYKKAVQEEKELDYEEDYEEPVRTKDRPAAAQKRAAPAPEDLEQELAKEVQKYM